jgi:hypothetical protein
MYLPAARTAAEPREVFMIRQLAIIASLAAAAPAFAQIQWTDWTQAAQGGAVGTLAGGTVTATVNAGSIHNWNLGGGTDYWRMGGGVTRPAYDGVSNIPMNTDFIAPDTGSYTFTFSEPLDDLYIAIISLGQPGVQTRWTFSESFTLVDQGPGAFGNGVFTIAGNQISAGEAHGIIRFDGPLSSLTLTSANGEFWSGLTFGTSGPATGGVIPEPATWSLLIAGFGLVGAAIRRRRTAVA